MSAVRARSKSPVAAAPVPDEATIGRLSPALKDTPRAQGKELEILLDRTCAICLQSPFAAIRLRCGHAFCPECLKRCAAHDHKACPTCRTSHELDPDVLRAELDKYRKFYRNWRVGAMHGSKGELYGLVAPPESVEVAASGLRKVAVSLLGKNPVVVEAPEVARPRRLKALAIFVAIIAYAYAPERWAVSGRRFLFGKKAVPEPSWTCAGDCAEPPINPGSFRLGWGSCNQQHVETPIHGSIADSRLDAFAFLGDNIYNDKDDCHPSNEGPYGDTCGVLRKSWATFRVVKNAARAFFLGEEISAYAQFLYNYGLFGESLEAEDFFDKVPAVLATWDDHDFGLNDAGAELDYKRVALAEFQRFWAPRSESMAKNFRPDGVFSSHDFGAGDRLVRVILLDTRFARTELVERDTPAVGWNGNYAVNEDVAARMIGEVQWSWLEAELAKPAALVVLASPTQILGSHNGEEHWANFPIERDRLVGIATKVSRPTLFLSGDIHYSELSRWPEKNLYDATSSGLTETWEYPFPNDNRVEDSLVRTTNFGVLDVDWEKENVGIEFRDKDGAKRYGARLAFADITPPAAN